MPPEAGRVAPKAWLVSLALTMGMAMGVATFIGFVVGVLAPFLLGEFSINRFQLGLLTTVMYLVGGLGAPVVGALVDRFGGRAILLALFALGGVGTVGVALAQSYLWLVAAMLLAGLALASGNPVTNKLLATHIPSETQGSVMGIKQAGVPMSKFLAGVLMPGLALWLGWRSAVLLCLLVPLGGLLGGALLLSPEGRRPASSVARRMRSSSGRVRWLTIYALLMGMGTSVVNVYLPLYAHEDVGMTVAMAGAAASVTGIVGVFSRVLWGRATGLFSDVVAPLSVIAACSAIAVCMVLGAQFVGEWVLWGGVFLFGASAPGWMVVGMTAVLAQADLRGTGRATGTVVLGFYSGFVAGPVVFGAIVDATRQYSFAWGLTVLLFGAACAVFLFRFRPAPRSGIACQWEGG